MLYINESPINNMFKRYELEILFNVDNFFVSNHTHELKEILQMNFILHEGYKVNPVYTILHHIFKITLSRK